jgi:hypothetical protein
MGIIGISGKIGSGKDTIAQIISETSEKQWEVKKFAGKLKQIASMLTGISVDKFEDQDFKNTFLGPEWDTYGVFRMQMKVRELLQKLGTEAMRNGLHTNTWVNALLCEYVPYHKGRAHDLQDYSEVYIHPKCHNCGKTYHGYKRQHLCKECIENNDCQIYPNWIITDVRFPNEYDAVKSKGGIIIRVNRPGFGTSMVALANAHPSETALDGHDFDHVIENNGDLDSLREKVIKLSL